LTLIQFGERSDGKGMEHEVYETRPEEHYGQKRRGTIMNEADIRGPDPGRADRDLRSESTDVDDDRSASALIGPCLKGKAQDRRSGWELAEREIATGHELGREARGQSPPDLIDARPGAAPCCDFAILRIPAERGKAFQVRRRSVSAMLEAEALARATSKT
jgi:hypothetical protein